MAKPKLWTKDFLLVCGGNFFVFLSFYTLLVSMPIYAIDQIGSDSVEAGLMTTIFLMAAIIIRPFAGYWMEKYSKRTVLIVAFIIFGGASWFYALPESINGLLLLRFIQGLGFGMSTTATGAIVADILPDSRRGEGMGYFILFVNVAMVLGPFLGLTLVNSWDASTLFLASMILAMLPLIFGFGIRLPKNKRQRENYSLRLKDLFEISAVPIAVIGGLLGMVYASILSFVSVYANGLGLTEVASYFFVVYAAVLLLSRPFSGKWYDLYGENRIVYPSLAFYAVGMFVLGIVDSPFVFILAAALIGLGWGTASPSFQTIAVQYAKPQRRGIATATYLSIFDLGISLGSFVVGFIVNNIGFDVIYKSSSVVIIIGMIMYYFIHGRKLKKSRQALQRINSLN